MKTRLLKCGHDHGHCKAWVELNRKWLSVNILLQLTSFVMAFRLRNDNLSRLHPEMLLWRLNSVKYNRHLNKQWQFWKTIAQCPVPSERPTFGGRHVIYGSVKLQWKCIRFAQDVKLGWSAYVTPNLGLKKIRIVISFCPRMRGNSPYWDMRLLLDKCTTWRIKFV